MAITRMTGLASGMDIDSMVAKLMKAERMPLDRLVQKQTTLEWQRDAYRGINTSMLDFRNQLFNMKLQSTYAAKSASIDTATSDYFSVSATVNATPGVYTLSVEKLAKSASTTSGNLTTTSGTAAIGSTALSDLGVGLTTTTSLTIGGQKGSATIQVDPTDTIDSFVSKVNANSSVTGVNVSFDSTLGSLFFVSNTTGAQAKVDLQSTDFSTNTNLISDVLNISATTTSPGVRESLNVGVNATVKFNGISGDYSTNNISINGMNFNLKKEQPGVAHNITVSGDTDSVFNSIKGFVDKYNNLLDTINTKINEPTYRGFPPLTDEQKQAMKDNDIKLWEDKAKSGLLHNDSIISTIAQSMRSSVYQEVTGLPPGDLKQLTEIGITTGSYQERGKLHIDEAKLRDALATKPDQVMRLFNANDGNSSTDLGDGLAVRLYDKMGTAIKQITDRAGAYSGSADNSVLGQSIRGLSTKIDSFNTRLTSIENRYYQQFTAMEKAINDMNSQSGWLSQFSPK